MKIKKPTERRWEGLTEKEMWPSKRTITAGIKENCMERIKTDAWKDIKDDDKWQMKDITHLSHITSFRSRREAEDLKPWNKADVVQCQEGGTWWMNGWNRGMTNGGGREVKGWAVKEEREDQKDETSGRCQQPRNWMGTWWTERYRTIAWWRGVITRLTV